MDLVRHLTLPSSGVDQLRTFLASHKKGPPEWQTSQLYSSSRSEKFVDEDLRQSFFQLFQGDVAKPLFDHLQEVVQHLSETDESYSYSLRTNDVTHIRYEKGGFFKRHRDFLSTTSNLIEEFTLLLCVTPDDLSKETKGGDTTIHGYGDSGSKSFDTHTPGSLLLFRKDMEHEGNEVLHGEKHILTANLWATRKQKPGDNSQVLLVTFADKADKDTSEEQQETPTEAIQRAADASASYVLPVSILSGVLKTRVEWANRRAEEQNEPPPTLVEYKCVQFSFEEFGTLAKILQRAHVGENELLQHAACLDFFGPFPTEHLLVDLALEEEEYEEDDDDNDDEEGEEGEEEDSEPAAKKGKTIHEDDDTDEDMDMDVIVCENEARMKAVMDVARLLNEPYVPFQMLFVEGVLATEGDLAGVNALEIPLTSPLFTVGEYNNVFSIQLVAGSKYGRNFETLKGLHNDSNYWDQWKKDGKRICAYAEDLLQNHAGESAEQIFPGYNDNDMEELINVGAMANIQSEGYGLSLLLGLGADDRHIEEFLQCFIFAEPGRYWPGNYLTILPGNTKTPTSDNNDDMPPIKQQDMVKVTSGPEDGLTGEVVSIDGSQVVVKDSRNGDHKTVDLSCLEKVSLISSDNNDPVEGSLFHRDEKGWTVFSREEAIRASDCIYAMDVEKRVKKALQKTRFELPQETGGVEAHFCNETVYGRLNILWVSGVLRLEQESSLKEKRVKEKVQLDVWPSAEAKADYERLRRAIQHKKETDEYGCGRVY